MRFIAGIIEKLQRHPKRVVFAGRNRTARPSGRPPVLFPAPRRAGFAGDRTQVKHAAAALNVSLEGVRIINPAESEDLPTFVKRYEMLRRYKGGLEEKEARETMLNPNYYGAMMLAMHQVDGYISGANQSSGSVLRPLFQIVKVAPEATTASSCMVMEVEDTRFGHEGTLFMADCGVIPEPTVQQLADIAVSTADLCHQLMAIRPAGRALLSYSTKGSATSASIGKVQAATASRPKAGTRQGIGGRFRRRTSGRCGLDSGNRLAQGA